MWGPALGFDGAEATKVFVCRNGHAAATKEVRLPQASKITDLLEKAAKALDIESPQIAFYSNGVECTDVEHLTDHEVLHISLGEPFKEPKNGSGGVGVQMAGDFILREKLGEGGFGSVVKGVHSETGDLAAVKFVAKKNMRQLSDLHRVFSEIQSLRHLKHPFVISIIDVVEHPDAIVFIMEYAGGGELRNYVEKHGPLSEDESRTFFKQIVHAVHYVHSKRIVHRDLKLENILLDRSMRCKIVDFGLADYVASNERTVTDAGTEAYLAPEVLTGTSGDSDPYKIDVWSLGVILYALAHRRLPFTRADPETCALMDERGPCFREGISEPFKHLDREMLTPCPIRRMPVDNITTHGWVAGRRFAHADTDDGEHRPEESDVDSDCRSGSHREAAASPLSALSAEELGPRTEAPGRAAAGGGPRSEPARAGARASPKAPASSSRGRPAKDDHGPRGGRPTDPFGSSASPTRRRGSGGQVERGAGAGARPAAGRPAR